MQPYSPVMKVMMDAVRKAVSGVVRDFGEVEKLQVSKKGPGDFVTTTDMRVEEMLVEQLTKARPSYGFLLEEGGEIVGEEDKFRWIIDPIDGTTNFLHGFACFCIAVALEENIAGKRKIVAAVVCDPVGKELFWAERGKGAWFESGDQSGHERLRVASRTRLDDTLLGFGSYRRRSDEYRDRGEKIMLGAAAVRDIGSAVLSFAYVAAGRMDGFVAEGLKPWDIAAGMLLVSEAGGFVTDFTGSAKMLECGNVLAANDRIHDSLLKIMSGK